MIEETTLKSPKNLLLKIMETTQQRAAEIRRKRKAMGYQAMTEQMETILQFWRTARPREWASKPVQEFVDQATVLDQEIRDEAQRLSEAGVMCPESEAAASVLEIWMVSESQEREQEEQEEWEKAERDAEVMRRWTRR